MKMHCIVGLLYENDLRMRRISWMEDWQIFIETTLASNLRIDGRDPVEYCKTRGKLLITIKFGGKLLIRTFFFLYLLCF